MAIGHCAKGTGPWLTVCAAMWMTMGCTQPDPEVREAGSGTELGNVMGILVSPGRIPAAGVEVMLYPLDTGLGADHVLRTTTDAEGAFAFQVEGGAFRLLSLDGAGNGATLDSLQPTQMDTLDLREVSLEPLGGIRGYVKSAPSGSDLKLIGTPFDTAFAADAEFVWEGIPPGTYWLEARQSAGMVAPNSGRVVVSVASGTVTELQDTLDLSTQSLELLPTDLPYPLFDMVRPANGLTVDSTFWMLNGVRYENPGHGESARQAIFTLTETMLDSTGTNAVQFFVHSGDSLFVARSWKITLGRSRPVEWAYQAVQAVLIAMEPDGRRGARRPGVQGGNSQLGTFRVLQSRLLAPEELEYWEWSAAAGGGAAVPESLQASIYNTYPLMLRGCYERRDLNPPHPFFPGDTVTFFLLPNSILGAVAFRVRTDERFQDLDRLGYFSRADWPLADFFSLHHKQFDLRMALRPEGLQIDWPRIFMFRGSDQKCQSTYRRFLVDSAGRVLEIMATPPGIALSQLLLHYRADFTHGIDADTLPTSGAFVFVDSTGHVVAGSPDSSRQFQLEAGALEELKALLSDLPIPIPADWHQEYAIPTWPEGPKEALRYLVSDQRGVLHIQEHPDAAPAKADLFSRVESWLRGRNLL